MLKGTSDFENKLGHMMLYNLLWFHYEFGVNRCVHEAFEGKKNDK